MPERMVENAQDKLHPRRSRRAIGDFAGDKSGASALEFALVATPFLLLIFAALEVGLVYFANFTLENAVSRGARLVRTGQAQTQQLDRKSTRLNSSHSQISYAVF